LTDMTKRAAGAKRADVTGHVVAYRIQRGAESLETLLDPRRPDGWTCDEERVETQPLGVSACSSEDDLRAYIREYSLAVREGDRLVRLRGRLSYDSDADRYAVRVMVERAEDAGCALRWLARGSR
jgi:hypothetical protein